MYQKTGFVETLPVTKFWMKICVFNDLLFFLKSVLLSLIPTGRAFHSFGPIVIKLQSSYVTTRLFRTTNNITSFWDIWARFGLYNLKNYLNVYWRFIMQGFMSVSRDFVFSPVLYGKPNEVASKLVFCDYSEMLW